VRKSGCSQAETDILAQNTVVLRYVARFILIKRAQKNVFSQVAAFMFSRTYSYA
jgi:hypothetical protein